MGELGGFHERLLRGERTGRQLGPAPWCLLAATSGLALGFRVLRHTQGWGGEIIAAPARFWARPGVGLTSPLYVVRPWALTLLLENRDPGLFHVLGKTLGPSLLCLGPGITATISPTTYETLTMCWHSANHADSSCLISQEPLQ